MRGRAGDSTSNESSSSLNSFSIARSAGNILRQGQGSNSERCMFFSGVWNACLDPITELLDRLGTIEHRSEPLSNRPKG
jgi:hypothetical protein